LELKISNQRQFDSIHSFLGEKLDDNELDALNEILAIICVSVASHYMHGKQEQKLNQLCKICKEI